MLVGIDRLVHDLRDLGYQDVRVVQDTSGLPYAVMDNFEIPAGTFVGRVIDLAIPAQADYPRSLPASMHLKATPTHLVPMGSTGRRNTLASNLGPQWQYWSYRFNPRPSNPTAELMSQINGIFYEN